MIKTLASANALEREKFRIPRNVQHSIPIKKIYRDGLWHSGNKHSCTWRFSDINYVSASDEDKRSIFMLYSSVINSLPTDAGVKISIVNHRLNPADFQRTMLMPYRDDGLDYLRAESNRINTDRTAASNNLVQEKYITLSIGEKRIEDSRAYFRRWKG